MSAIFLIPETGTEKKEKFMALTKAKVKEILSAAGVADDKISDATEQIINGHVASIEALREDVEKYKAEAEKLPDTQKELADLQKKIEDGEKDPYKVKYEAQKEEFEAYKAKIEKEKTTANKRDAYRDLLKAAGVADKRIDAVIRVSDIDGLELDEEGKIKDSDKLTETIKTDWADFIETTGEQGASTATPPATPKKPEQDLGKLSMADYIKARKES